METIIKKYSLALSALIFTVFVISCSDRDLSKLDKATQNKTTAEVFIDGFSGGEDFNAWGKVTNFNLDANEVYNGAYSIRIDVPNATDAGGSWAGGNIFTSAPRDLSGYDCLTFYAKSNVATTLTAGYGIDSKYKVTANLSLNTTWTKFIIPIPSPAVLTAVKGMFYYSAAPVNNLGYSIYIDDIKYEKLGTLAHPTIQNNLSGTMFLGKTAIGDITLVVNLPSGGSQTITCSASYFNFTSSDESVATVSNDTINIVSAGTANIAASGYEGGFVVNSNGIGAAPVPTYPANAVLSIFSDSYGTNIYNFWCGATKIADVYVGTNKMFNFTKLDWTCMVNFNESTSVGYQDASSYGFLHIDVMTPITVTSSSSLIIKLGNYSTGSKVETQIYSYTYKTTDKLKWVQLDIPLTIARSKVGFITFAGANLSNVYVDNVYYHN